ncbi:hypothetical protein IMSHALPRED_002095, partial [Imshaugia aleurites]
MLTAEEQWKIIQEKEEREGGRGRRKKTFQEQLEDMGGFNSDPDSEKAILEDLERTDTRRPLQRSKASISHGKATFGEPSFWVSRKRLFHSWVFQAKRPSSWIKEEDLPLFFRFALRRPILDELTLQIILQDMNLKLKKDMGHVRQPYTRPIGRSRKLMFGIDVDSAREIHPSSTLIDVLPKGAADNMDTVTEEATMMVQQEDEDTQQLVRRQLWAVYEHVENGSVPLETATWHYRDAFNNEDMSDENLVVCLQQLGIPTDHIPTSERNAHRGSAHSPLSSGVEQVRRDIGTIAAPDERESRILKELAGYIKLYRGGTLHEHEVVPMIQQCLFGLRLDATIISDVLTDLTNDEGMAANLIWEEAAETPVSSSSSSSSSEDESEGSDEEDDDHLRAVSVPHSLAKEEENHNAAEASHVEGRKSSDELTTEDMNHQDDDKKNESVQSEAMSIDHPIMNTPALSPRERPTRSHVNEAGSKTQPPGTPRPKPASLAPAINEMDSQTDPVRSHANEAESKTQPPDTPRPKPASFAPAINEMDSQTDLVRSHVNEAESKTQPPGTPRPKPASLAPIMN